MQIDQFRLSAGTAMLCESQNWRCAYCSVVFVLVRRHEHSPTVDEVVPRAAGGKREWANQVAACAGCNNLKAVSNAHKFFREVQNPDHPRHQAADVENAREQHLKGGRPPPPPRQPLVPEEVPMTESRRRYFEMFYGSAPA